MGDWKVAPPGVVWTEEGTHKGCPYPVMKPWFCGPPNWRLSVFGTKCPLADTFPGVGHLKRPYGRVPEQEPQADGLSSQGRDRAALPGHTGEARPSPRITSQSSRRKPSSFRSAAPM